MNVDDARATTRGERTRRRAGPGAARVLVYWRAFGRSASASLAATLEAAAGRRAPGPAGNHMGPRARWETGPSHRPIDKFLCRDPARALALGHSRAFRNVA